MTTDTTIENNAMMINDSQKRLTLYRNYERLIEERTYTQTSVRTRMNSESLPPIKSAQYPNNFHNDC